MLSIPEHRLASFNALGSFIFLLLVNPILELLVLLRQLVKEVLVQLYYLPILLLISLNLLVLVLQLVKVLIRLFRLLFKVNKSVFELGTFVN